MTYTMCGHAAPEGAPDAGQGACCMGAAMNGPQGCGCWVAVLSADQWPPDPLSPAGSQPAPCADCAYRPGSPERQGDPTYGGDQQLLDRLVADATPFWCHQGMVRVVGWQHPSGVWYPAPGGSYQPPLVDHGNGRTVPYWADGTAGLVCAGWLARVLAASR